ncbi:MAG: pyridoxal phosphate-dependent decarboxylase family protein, partial [Terriglobales bacterium]
MFDTEFFTPQNGVIYRESVLKAISALQEALPAKAYSGKSASELAELLERDVLPAGESSLAEVVRHLHPVIANSVVLTHRNTIAHLHCPPLIASLVGEVVLSALNQSMDSFDQAPAATILELAVSRWICAEAGLPAGSDAIFTSGATQSNFMALLLARDVMIASRWSRSVRRQGLPPEAGRLRILCSEVAHFTVEKSLYQLGLGTDALIKIPVDDSFRMIPDALA